MASRTLISLAIAFLLALFVPPQPGRCAGAPRYQIAGLGGMPGFTEIEPVAMNSKEQIVGTMVRGEELHGFLWQKGRFTDLGLCHPVAIDDSGRILLDYKSQSYLWDNAILLPLGELTSEGNEADAMNAKGDVVGAVGNQGKSNGIFLWTNYQIRRLPVKLPVMGNGPDAWTIDLTSINNQDWVIGRTAPPNSDTRYDFLYENGKTRLLLPKDSTVAWPEAINNKGWVLGDAKVRNKPITYAFLWRDGQFIQVGPGSDAESSTGTALNDHGQVIGEVSAGEPAYTFFWQDGRRYDLDKLIVNGSGWSERHAVAIDNRGVIVGWGVYRGQDSLFLLTPITK